MQAIVQYVTEQTGLSQPDVQRSIDAALSFLAERLPAAVVLQINRVIDQPRPSSAFPTQDVLEGDLDELLRG